MSTVSRALLRLRQLRIGRSLPSLGQWRQLSANQQRLCPACSTPLPTALPTCSKCSHIEPLPPSMTHFDVFGLPPSDNQFALDTKDLRQKFLQAQRVCHPDTWSRKGKREQAIAVAQSSYLNTAYRTLTSPVLRAQYILTQHGHPPLETDKLTDQALIMEIMDAREELDNATSHDDVLEIQRKNDARMRKTYDEIECHIRANNWDQASKAAVKLKYLEGIDTAVKEWTASRTA